MRVSLPAAAAALGILSGIAHADENYLGRTIASACFGCHGAGSAGGAAIPPIIKGAQAEYLEEQMKAFRDGSRKGTIMGRIAKGYTDEEITAVSAYLAASGGIE